MTQYTEQARGSDSAYERYLQAMDASMQQKVALTAAHLLGEGWLADMGMGSGTGSEALASLYPKIRVTGVDINPEMVERATERYSLPNLDFRAGDIAEECFAPESLDMIFNSSVLHHVTTFNNYDAAQAKRAICNQVRQLKMSGNLIIRDFLRPADGSVVLELPDEEAELLEKFSKEFRFLLPEEDRGFAFVERPRASDGWRRFELTHSLAVEFVLRKDYLTDWKTEVLEEYTYFKREEFEAVFRSQGLRILASTPIRNPWIVRNRFVGKFRMKDPRGSLLDFPPTNYLIVGEKVTLGKGVEHRVGGDKPTLDYLSFAHFKNVHNGNVRDLVRRPNSTLDVIPYFRENGETYVLARRSYPRPVLALCEHRLDGCLSPTYVTEPIVVIQQDKPMAQTVEEELEARIGLTASQIRGFQTGSHLYPSPGGLQERVEPVFVEVEPLARSAEGEKVRAVAARQLVRAAQVDGLPDARLEAHCVQLLNLLQEPVGSWIGEQLKLQSHDHEPPRLLLDKNPRRSFVPDTQSANFLECGSKVFQELSADSQVASEIQLDFVVPKRLSLNTVALAPLWQTGTDIFVGLHDDDFPAAQCFTGHSNLIVLPAWRLPREVTNLLEMREFTNNALLREYGVQVRDFFTLGGPYYPSPGVTPEIVYPLAVDVKSVSESAMHKLHWVPISTVSSNLADYLDGHLSIVVGRAFRALNSHS